MTDSRRPVLIGDNQPARAEWLSRFLGDYYNVAAQTAETFDKVCDLMTGQNYSVIFLADTLPYSYNIREELPQSYVSQLRGMDSRVRFVFLVTRDTYPYLFDVPHQICYARLPSAAPTPAERDHIIEALRPLGNILPLLATTVEEVAALSDWGDDRVLNEQIRSLSVREDLEEGKWHLGRIIRNCLDCRGVEKILVEKLTQGASGARVFHLTVARRRAGRLVPEEYVLKLSEEQEVWKLQREISGYLQASDSKAYSKYKAHLPALQTPQISRLATAPSSKGAADPLPEEFSYMASSLTWSAIYYDFVGGPIGECMSLETALLADRGKILQKLGGAHESFTLPAGEGADLTPFRLGFMDTLLKALCGIWYLRAEGDPVEAKRREVRLLWETGDAPERRYDPLPPYRLTARTKRWAGEFLVSEVAELGGRVFQGWDECRDHLYTLIRHGGRPLPGVLGRELPVVLTPAHGDLNAGNVFLWLREAGFPFLIDLPFFQRLGHALQDFARLEVEVKFALMDRQKESPASRLAAYDHSPTQARLWQELELRLLDERAGAAEEPAWQARGFRDNVKLTYGLVKLIRAKAEVVQQQSLPGDPHGPVPFMDEYLPALLYHTVRAATYPTLTIFKRLFAVYSAGLILRRLGFPPD
jgi:hypothetical protein